MVERTDVVKPPAVSAPVGIRWRRRCDTVRVAQRVSNLYRTALLDEGNVDSSVPSAHLPCHSHDVEHRMRVRNLMCRFNHFRNEGPKTFWLILNVPEFACLKILSSSFAKSMVLFGSIVYHIMVWMVK
jgi:hypothetical protein